MGPKINLEPFLSDLQRKKEDGETWDELAAWLQEEHNITCDARTIRRRFTDVAGFSAINLGPYMNEIVQQREESVPFHDIVDNLMATSAAALAEMQLLQEGSNRKRAVSKTAVTSSSKRVVARRDTALRCPSQASA